MCVCVECVHDVIINKHYIYAFCHFQDVENELVVQVSMKQEMELAMKLLEKDIHEKQVRTNILFFRTDSYLLILKQRH